MKRKNHLIAILSVGIVMLTGCDKGFEELNKNPQGITSIEPGFVFTNGLRGTPSGGIESDQTVAFQTLNAYSGLTTGFNLNQLQEAQNNGRWNNSFSGPVKNLTHVINAVKDVPERSNLYNEARIWLAYTYMNLVDTYGDVPYTEAGKAVLEGIFFPKYDKDSDIYVSLRTELKEASAALDPAKNNEAKYDLFYQGDINKWKRLANSLLLRLGMRYSKQNPTLAAQIVTEAVNAAGGVMLTNADNVVITYNTVNTNGLNGLRNTNSNYYYFAEPFITQLRSTKYPRLKFLAAKYTNAGGDHSQVNPDTVINNQVGFPIGQDNVSILTYPGRVIPTTAGGGFAYSQINFLSLGNALTPLHVVTNAQTKLLLAEAAKRGWVPGGDAQAEIYYQAGVRASMDEYALYPYGTTGFSTIPAGVQTAYLNRVDVAYTPADALKLINIQYWIASFRNGTEAWVNRRRSGFPVLTPNPASPVLAGDGFVHRFTYPVAEQNTNTANYQNAKARIGGSDNFVTRVFWDIP